MSKFTVDLGEYKIVIDHGDNGYLEVIIQDELGDEIEGMSVENEDDENSEEKDEEKQLKVWWFKIK